MHKTQFCMNKILVFLRVDIVACCLDLAWNSWSWTEFDGVVRWFLWVNSEASCFWWILWRWKWNWSFIVFTWVNIETSGLNFWILRWFASYSTSFSDAMSDDDLMWFWWFWWRWWWGGGRWRRWWWRFTRRGHYLGFWKFYYKKVYDVNWSNTSEEASATNKAKITREIFNFILMEKELPNEWDLSQVGPFI